MPRIWYDEPLQKSRTVFGAKVIIRTWYEKIRQFLAPLIPGIKWNALVLFLFALLALAAMYPVVPSFRSHVLGAPGDNVQYAYMTGWVGQSLLLGESPFFDPRLNYPDGLALPATDAPFLSMLLVAPVTWLLGPTFAYNLIIFLSHTLSGYFVYLWIAHLTGNRMGGFVAGVIFLLAPYRLVHSYGHLHMVSTQMLPLFFWSLNSTLTPPRPRELNLWLLGGATFLVGSMSQYYLVMCLVTGVAYALLLLLPRLDYLFNSGWRLVVSVFFGTLLAILPSFSMLSCGIFQPYGVGRTRIWSADPVNFLLPWQSHPLWGSWINQLRPEPFSGEKTLYLGIVPLILAGAGFWLAQKGLRGRVRVWLAVALIAAIFALGTDLWINNEPLQHSNPFWLPAYYLSHVPLLGTMRVWSRFGAITLLFVSLLAGIGTIAILEHSGRWNRLVLALILVLVLVDFLPGNAGVAPLGPRPIDAWLAQQPGDFAVGFLPPEEDTANYQVLFGSLFHAKQAPAFIHAQHMPRAYREFMLTAYEFPAPAAIEELHDMRLRYLLLERSRYNGWRVPVWSEIEAAIASSPKVKVVTEVGDFVVLEFAEP
ncbi:MAG: YfhO family protein [Chloroflexaceae bacterium]|nr:YfhO family protein [Chloroflexaceae bacterium]